MELQGIDRVRQFFAVRGREGDVIEFDVSSATVDLAAQALGTDGARIAKSLALYDDEEGAVLVVAAGDARIDNKKFRERFHRKASFCKAEDTLRYTGYAVGGVCPFALATKIPVFLDISLKRFETVFPACGSSNSAIELPVEDLESYTAAAGWVDVCKDWQAD